MSSPLSQLQESLQAKKEIKTLHFRDKSIEPPPQKSQSLRHSICPVAQCPRYSGLVEFHSEVQPGRTNKKIILLPIPVPWPGLGFLGSSAEVAGVGGEQSGERKSSSSLFSLGEGGGFLKQPPGMPTLLHCLSEASQLNRREGANFAIFFRNEPMEPWESHPAASKIFSSEGSRNIFT